MENIVTRDKYLLSNYSTNPQNRRLNKKYRINKQLKSAKINKNRSKIMKNKQVITSKNEMRHKNYIFKGRENSLEYK